MVEFIPFMENMTVEDGSRPNTTGMKLLRLVLFLVASLPVIAQSISSGTIEGVVNDPSGAVVQKAKVEIRNPVTGYSQSAATDDAGAFRLTNIPLNPYRLQVTVAGFQTYAQNV